MAKKRLKEAPGSRLSQLKTRKTPIPRQGPAFTGDVSDMNNPQFKIFLRQNNVSPDEFFHVRKQMPQATPDEVVKNVRMRQMAPTMLGMQQFARTRKTFPKPGSQVVPPPTNLTRREGKAANMTKKITLTEAQLKETIKRAVLIHEKKRVVQKIVTEQIREQMHVAKLCESLLKEGPLTGVWQGLKQGAGALGKGVKQAFGGAGQAFAQGQAQAQAQQQMQQAVQAAQKQLQAAQKAVAQAKQKYNQELLKNAEVLNQYHDAVVNLYQTFQGVKDQLGPAAQQMEQDVMGALGQLQNDLRSEQSQIAAFMDQLQKSAPNVQMGGRFGVGAAAQKKDQERRDKEASEYGGSSMGMAANRPGMLQKSDNPNLQPSIARQAQQQSQKKSEKSKKSKK